MGNMWFGTRDYMTWIACPAVGMGASKVGWRGGTNFLNGGAYVKQSVNAHKEYDLTWNLASRDTARVIQDFADGIYGIGPFYFADPFAMDKNMLPQSYAAPFLGVHDGPILSGDPLIRPVAAATALNSNGYPTVGATYTISVGNTPTRTWVPIPPGYTAWVGAKGVAGTGGTVVAIPTLPGGGDAAAVTIPLSSVTSTTRVSNSFASSSYKGVKIGLGGFGSVTVTAIIVQLLPTGSVPSVGGFISGQGNSGCLFDSQPSVTQYSAALDKIGLSAKLIEVGQWQ